MNLMLSELKSPEFNGSAGMRKYLPISLRHMDKTVIFSKPVNFAGKSLRWIVPMNQLADCLCAALYP